MGGIAFVSQCVKQADIAASTNDSEIRSMFHATKRTMLYRSILRSMGMPQDVPTPTHEDNAAAISQVMSDRLTPRVKHIDTLISFLNEQYSRQQIVPITTTSKAQKGDMNTKPHGGSTLQTKNSPWLVTSFIPFYSPPTSNNYS